MHLLETCVVSALSCQSLPPRRLASTNLRILALQVLDPLQTPLALGQIEIPPLSPPLPLPLLHSESAAVLKSHLGLTKVCCCVLYCQNKQLSLTHSSL